MNHMIAVPVRAQEHVTQSIILIVQGHKLHIHAVLARARGHAISLTTPIRPAPAWFTLEELDTTPIVQRQLLHIHAVLVSAREHAIHPIILIVQGQKLHIHAALVMGREHASLKQMTSTATAVPE